MPAYLIASRDAVSPTWRAGTGPSYTESGFLRAPSLSSDVAGRSPRVSIGDGIVAGVRRGPLRRRRAGRNQAAPLVYSRALPPHNPNPGRLVAHRTLVLLLTAEAESKLPARTYSRARMRRRFRTLTRAWNWRVRRCSCRCRSTKEISNLETENAACSL